MNLIKTKIACLQMVHRVALVQQVVEEGVVKELERHPFLAGRVQFGHLDFDSMNKM
jgi:hypothetical protein